MTQSTCKRRRRFAFAGVAVMASLFISGVAEAQDGISLIRDAEIEDILREDAEPLFKAAGLQSDSIRILLIGSRDIQASASPRQMAVYTGLILETENPNQLQGVMAHEVGHLAGGHLFRSGEMARAGLKPMILTMGLGVLAALAGSADGAAVLLGNAQYAGALGALGYSREQESRADQAGATYLQTAGLSGRGLVEFFNNFRYQEIFDQARRFAYFRSHPLSSDRIEALRGRVSRQSHYDEVDGPAALAKHEVMKAKLLGFISPQAALIRYKEGDRSFPARYARAIAYYQMKDPDRAVRMTDELIAENPDNPYLWELKGQILFEFNRIPLAEAPQRRSVELKPDASLLRVNLGQTLVGLDDPQKVAEGVDQLKRALLDEPDNAVAWRLLAQTYNKQGKDGLARLATAEEYFQMGMQGEAKLFALRARSRLPRSSPEWLRATDIFLASSPTQRDLQELKRADANPDS